MVVQFLNWFRLVSYSLLVVFFWNVEVMRSRKGCTPQENGVNFPYVTPDSNSSIHIGKLCLFPALSEYIIGLSLFGLCLFIYTVNNRDVPILTFRPIFWYVTQFAKTQYNDASLEIQFVGNPVCYISKFYIPKALFGSTVVWEKFDIKKFCCWWIFGYISVIGEDGWPILRNWYHCAKWCLNMKRLCKSCSKLYSILVICLCMCCAWLSMCATEQKV